MQKIKILFLGERETGECKVGAETGIFWVRRSALHRGGEKVHTNYPTHRIKKIVPLD